VLPAVDNIATFLQSYVATGKHIQDLPTLAHLRSELSRSATAQQMRSLALAVASLSSRLDNTATKDQANGPATLGQDIIAEQSNGAAASSPLHSVKEMTGLKKIVESSNLMLETLMQRVPPHPIQSPGTGSLDDSKQPQGSSQTRSVKFKDAGLPRPFIWDQSQMELSVAVSVIATIWLR
jgi:hypothetical protein